jgi:NADPH:quinone reductase-like Zn-dependent oxidoreductase
VTTAEQVPGDALSIRAGELLLIHGANGVTGDLLAALAVLRGAEVIATAGLSGRQRPSAGAS